MSNLDNINTTDSSNNEQHSQNCFICNNAHTYRKAGTNTWVCATCYKKLYAPQKNCSICGLEKSVTKYVESKPVCQTCYMKFFRPKYTCSECGRLATCAKKVNGSPVCNSCYTEKYRKKAECSLCNKKDFIAKYIDSKPICTSCYSKQYRPKVLCSMCGQEGYNSKYVNTKPICHKCYNAFFRPLRVCSSCGKEDIAIKYIDDTYICPACYQRQYRPKNTCSICGSYEAINKYIGDTAICKKCYNRGYRPLKTCFCCGKERSVESYANGQPVCYQCYHKFYRPKRICASCNKEEFVGRYIDGKPLCESCYRKLKFTCNNCGIAFSDIRNALGICSECWYTKKADDFLTYAKKVITNEYLLSLFLKYKEILFEFRSRRHTYYYLQNDIKVLILLNSQKEINFPITYNYYTSLCEQSNCILSTRLTNFLVREGIVLNQSCEEEIKELRNTLSSELENSFNEVFYKYIDHLLNINRKYMDRGQSPRLSYITLRLYINICYNFLQFVSNRIGSIYEINDSIIDEYYLSTWPNKGRHFLIWLNKNTKLFKKLRIKKPNKGEKISEPYTEDEFIHILDSIDYSNIYYKDKVITYLLLFYGIRPFEQTKIKLCNFNFDVNSSLKIRNSEIQIHPFISDTIQKYIELERSCGLSLGVNEYLFPGNRFDTAASYATISNILSKHSISSLRGFATAISNSIICCNSPYIAIKCLGISFSTAINYYKTLRLDDAAEAIEATYNMELNNSTNNHYVYILQCEDGSYYVGYTSNLEKRLKQHNTGNGSKYTRSRRPLELVYFEVFSDKLSALKRERQIKKYTHFNKTMLIEKWISK